MACSLATVSPFYPFTIPTVAKDEQAREGTSNAIRDTVIPEAHGVARAEMDVRSSTMLHKAVDSGAAQAVRAYS